MGMFNSITIDESIALPDLPPEISRKNLVFQTKDLDENLMLNFRVNAEKNLEIFKQKGEWFDNPEIKFFGQEFRVDAEWWEFYEFTGVINIYESYDHPDYQYVSHDSPESYRFECGWIEWNVKFVDGVMVNILSTKGKLPIKRTDDELQNYRNECERSRKEFDDKFKKNRLEHPTPEQKLIDKIDEITQRNYVIPEIEDYYTLLREIQNNINEYRNKHDKWYGTAPEQD